MQLPSEVSTSLEMVTGFHLAGVVRVRAGFVLAVMVDELHTEAVGRALGDLFGQGRLVLGGLLQQVALKAIELFLRISVQHPIINLGDKD